MFTTTEALKHQGLGATPIPDGTPWAELGPQAVVLGLDEDKYHAVHGMCSASQLKTLENSTALHLSHRLSTPMDTPAMRVGRALHCGILEPDHLSKRFAVAPKIDRRTKAGKADWLKFEESAGNATVLTQPEGDQVSAMMDAIYKHKFAVDLLDSCSIREATILAALFGAPCKSRVDAMSPCGKVICDLKTTGTLASRKEMESVMWRYGYGLQMCMYREMIRANGGDCEQVTIIAIEKTIPYAVCVFVVTPEIMDLHLPRLERLIGEWKETIGVGLTPGWSETPIPIGVPDWARKDLEIEAEMAAAMGGAQ